MIGVVALALGAYGEGRSRSETSIAISEVSGTTLTVSPRIAFASSPSHRHRMR
jgi:hypothetical protein